MHLHVDFINSDANKTLEKSIITRLKESFTQSFIASIKVILKKSGQESKEWKTEIELVSHAGSILYTQSSSEKDVIAFESAFESLQKKIVKLKNEKGQRA